MDRLPPEMIQTIGSHVQNNKNLASFSGSSKSLRDSLKPVMNARKVTKGKILGVMERMKQEATDEKPIRMFLVKDNIAYEFGFFIFRFTDLGAFYVEQSFESNKKPSKKRFECRFMINDNFRREGEVSVDIPTVSMRDALEKARDVLNFVMNAPERNPLDKRCNILDAIPVANRFFVVATIMTLLYDLLSDLSPENIYARAYAKAKGASS